MPTFRFVRSTGVGAAALALLGVLGACASQPAGSLATAPTPKAGAPAPMRVVTMAPIPNPPEHPAATQASRGVTRAAPRANAAPATAVAHALREPAGPSASTEGPNPTEAARLRTAALVQLNRGAINQAVALLEQANRLDPANPVIKRDLERAERISKAVAARR